MAGERIGQERLGAYCDRVKEAFEAYVACPHPIRGGWGGALPAVTPVKGVLGVDDGDGDGGDDEKHDDVAGGFGAAGDVASGGYLGGVNLMGVNGLDRMGAGSLANFMEDDDDDDHEDKEGSSDSSSDPDEEQDEHRGRDQGQERGRTMQRGNSHTRRAEDIAGPDIRARSRWLNLQTAGDELAIKKDTGSVEADVPLDLTLDLVLGQHLPVANTQGMGVLGEAIDDEIQRQQPVSDKEGFMEIDITDPIPTIPNQIVTATVSESQQIQPTEKSPTGHTGMQVDIEEDALPSTLR